MSIVNILYVYSFWVLLPVVALGAWRWGGEPGHRMSPERWAALAYVSAALATALRWTVQGWTYTDLTFVGWGIDLCLIAATGGIALTSDRWWPIFATSWLVLSALAHAAKLLRPDLVPAGYQLLNQLSAYPALAILSAGIWRQHRRVTSGQAGSQTCSVARRPRAR